jgi:hypothetical protein
MTAPKSLLYELVLLASLLGKLSLDSKRLLVFDLSAFFISLRSTTTTCPGFRQSMAQVPSNGNCGNATEFFTFPVSVTGTTVGSLPDVADKCSTSTNNHGVWYTFSPLIDIFMTISTSAANFQHEIVLMSGDSCALALCTGIQAGTFHTLASSASITFIAKAGTKYYILVTGYLGNSDADTEGDFTLNVEVSPSHP